MMSQLLLSSLVNLRAPHVYRLYDPLSQYRNPNKTPTTVYVGSSINVLGRIGAHLGRREMEFGNVEIIECSSLQEMNELEKSLIEKLRPRYNKAGVTYPYAKNRATQSLIQTTRDGRTYSLPK